MRSTSRPSAARRNTTSSSLAVGDRAALTQAHELLLDGPDLYPSPFAALGFAPLDLVPERERLISEGLTRWL